MELRPRPHGARDPPASAGQRERVFYRARDEGGPA